VIAVTGHAHRLDQALLAKMPEVPGARVGRSVVVVPKVTTGDHSKRTNGRQRTGLRAAQGVLTVAITNKLALQSARQVEVPREGIPRVSIALTMVAVPLRPTRIIVAIAPMLVRGLPIVARTAAERPRIFVISIARSEVRLPPVVIPIAVVGGTTVPAIRSTSVPLVVARVVITRVKIEHAALR
jgi:hypothetical protein